MKNKLTRLRLSAGLLALAAFILLFASTSTANWLHAYGITSKHELKQPAAAPKLAKALKDPNPKIRVAAIRFLINMRGDAKEAIPALGEVLLTDFDLNIRLLAADALGAIGGPYNTEAAPPLLRSLSDPNVHIRKRALLIFQKNQYRGTDLQDQLQKMAATDPHPGLRKLASAILLRTTNWSSTQPAVLAGEDRAPAGDISNLELPPANEINRHAVAVIIGNRNYAAAKKGVPDVDYAHNDADLMYRYVTTTLGYREGNIIFIKDATQADFISTFGSADNPRGKLYDWIRPGVSDVFIYYSGHGTPGLSTGASYLLPVNGDPMKVELNGYPLATLYTNIGKLPAKSTMVVIDACFSGGSASGSLVKSASSIALRVAESKPPVPNQATVLTAAKQQEVASWDDEAQHGLFTRHFIEGISGRADTDDFGNRDGIVTLGELKKYLGEEVGYRARRQFGRDQHPQVNGDEGRVLTMLPTSQAAH